MKSVALESPEIAEALLDLETGLAIARTLYTNYFEKVGESAQLYFEGSRNDIAALIGAVIDYMRSAQVTLEAIEEENEAAKADRKESPQHTTE